MVGHYRFDSDVGRTSCQVRYNRLFRGESRIYPRYAQEGSAGNESVVSTVGTHRRPNYKVQILIRGIYPDVAQFGSAYALGA